MQAGCGSAQTPSGAAAAKQAHAVFPSFSFFSSWSSAQPKWHGYYGDTPCWVFTHRDLPKVPGADLSFVHDDVERVHKRMVQAAGDKNVWIVGGGDLAGQFADQCLLDEIHLQLAPVTLGHGAPLLPRQLLASNLSLTTVDRDGQFVHLIYRVTTTASGSS